MKELKYENNEYIDRKSHERQPKEMICITQIYIN